MKPIYLNLSNVFLGIGGFLIIKYWNNITGFGKIKNNIIGKAIISISICSYGMYYAHFIIIRALSLLEIKSSKLVPLIVILIVILSWGLTYIFSKIPYLKKFSGV